MAPEWQTPRAEFARFDRDTGDPGIIDERAIPNLGRINHACRTYTPGGVNTLPAAARSFFRSFVRISSTSFFIVFEQRHSFVGGTRVASALQFYETPGDIFLARLMSFLAPSPKGLSCLSEKLSEYPVLFTRMDV